MPRSRSPDLNGMIIDDILVGQSHASCVISTGIGKQLVVTTLQEIHTASGQARIRRDLRTSHRPRQRQTFAET